MTPSPRHQYELTNHLGNVSVIVSDNKLLSANQSQKLYLPDVLEYQDYYPFGMVMNDRKGSYNTQDYRYGYNGKENDNEVKGESNQQDYGFRVYDPRVGRFLSMDPLTKDFAMLTPYQFASNMPIAAIDIDGLEARIIVYEIGQNSIFSYSVDLTDPNINPNYVLYADQNKYGKRGDLTIIKNVNSGEIISKFDIGLLDGILNYLQGDRGGIMFTMSNGQGKETRISPNSKMGENLDDLFEVFGLAKAVANEMKSAVDLFDYSFTLLNESGININDPGYENAKGYFDNRVTPNVHEIGSRVVGGPMDATSVMPLVSKEGDSVTYFSFRGDVPIDTYSIKAVKPIGTLNKLIELPKLIPIKDVVKDPKQ